MSRISRAQRHLNIVAVCYQLHPADFAARLQSLASRSGFKLRGSVTCNNAMHAGTAAPCDLTVVQGSNSLLDFSGFFEGLEHLLAQDPETEEGNVLFVNDTLFTKHAAGCILGYLLDLDPMLRRLAVAAIAGKMDTYQSVCLRNPWSGLPGFVTTFCFLLNSQALSALRHLKSDAVADGVLTDIDPSSPDWGHSLPADFREFIRAHLVYAESPFIWPSASTSAPSLLRKKASCVYFESRLSGVIASSGAMVPINAGPRARTNIFLRELGTRAWRRLANLPR